MIRDIFEPLERSKEYFERPNEVPLFLVQNFYPVYVGRVKQYPVLKRKELLQCFTEVLQRE